MFGLYTNLLSDLVTCGELVVRWRIWQIEHHFVLRSPDKLAFQQIREETVQVRRLLDENLPHHLSQQPFEPRRCLSPPVMLAPSPDECKPRASPSRTSVSPLLVERPLRPFASSSLIGRMIWQLKISPEPALMGPSRHASSVMMHFYSIINNKIARQWKNKEEKIYKLHLN